MAVSRGKNGPTQTDVAARAGVSRATVSYVLSGRSDRGAPATEEVIRRVREAASELRYQPQRAGRVLQSRRTNLIAVATYRQPNAWSSTIISQAEEVADEHRLGIITLPFDQSVRSRDRAVSLLLDDVTDAAIILNAPALGQERLAALAARPRPILAFGAATPGGSVEVLDQREAVAIGEVVRHLVATGARRIAHLAELQSFPSRRRAVVEAARDAGLDDDALVLIDSPDDGYAVGMGVYPSARRLLQSEPEARPDAIIVNGDRDAISVMWAANQLGLQIPQDIRIVGAGNIDEGRMVSPQLTTIGVENPDYRPLIEHLIARIDAPAQPLRTWDLPWQLIRRGTA